jgi:hypothetical protein
MKPLLRHRPGDQKNERLGSAALRRSLTHLGPKVVGCTSASATAASSEFGESAWLHLGAPSATATLNRFLAYFRCHYNSVFALA